MKKELTPAEKKRRKIAIRIRWVIWAILCCVWIAVCAIAIQHFVFEGTECATDENTFEIELIPTNIEGRTFHGGKGREDQYLLIQTEEDAYFIEWVNGTHRPLGKNSLQDYVDQLQQEEKLYAQVYYKKMASSSKLPLMWEIVALRGEEKDYYLLEYHNDTQKGERVFAWILLPFLVVAVFGFAFAFFEIIMGKYAERVNKKIKKKFKKLFKRRHGDGSVVS